MTASQTEAATGQHASLHTFTVFPEDLNYTGSLFGGKLLAEMDVAAIKPVRRILYGTACDGAVTVSLDKVDFKNPAYLGDIIELHASIIRLGRTSMDVAVHVSREDQTGEVATICEARFTFVSLKDNEPCPHGQDQP
jgi:acyl-CoA hydrolase